MYTKNNRKNQIISDVIANSILLSLFTSQIAYATDNDVVDNILVEVTQVLLVVAGLLCLGKLIQIGIMYMTSSAVEKSNAKAALMPWLAGTIVAFGASLIGPAIIKMITGSSTGEMPPVLDY